VIQYYGAKKEKAQEVQRDQCSEGGVEGRAGDASAGKALREQEARQEKRQAQTQPGQVASGCRSRIDKGSSDFLCNGSSHTFVSRPRTSEQALRCLSASVDCRGAVAAARKNSGATATGTTRGATTQDELTKAKKGTRCPPAPGNKAPDQKERLETLNKLIKHFQKTAVEKSETHSRKSKGQQEQ
jgi:hypothetical protein